MTSIILYPPGNVQAGPILIEFDFQIGEGLIVFEPYIELGTMPLYQVKLKDKGFLIGTGNKEVEVVNSTHHAEQFCQPFLFHF